ncbi:hypothetical protein GWO43_02215 [candidate division KSB1 bacterium]|nr:hypothetical protein [candidate division KSB1 bacterium]NIR69656.1 hypothetical protein [candidate division KSB1 bacterium]NIS22885.1 hypothetical protein [candidate division KSB1 bacterium]NIT69724.1 hypothetical protein [candidate division KSB1 bacterium]NIU23391.1 hypothetical protein [candidate division KSB1 bacterium]
MKKLIVSQLLFLTLTGCSSWHAVQKADVEQATYDQSRFNITLKDGRSYETSHYVLSQDSLLILAETPSAVQRNAVPLDQIASIRKEEKMSPLKSALIKIGSALGIFAILGLAQGASGS